MQISRDAPHYQHRRWSVQDFEALQHLAKQLRMYCAKIRAALAPIREAVSPRNLASCPMLRPPPAQSTMSYDPLLTSCVPSAKMMPSAPLSQCREAWALSHSLCLTSKH